MTERTTFTFVGVTTAQSSIMGIFPRWVAALGRPEVSIVGIDHPLHDTPEAYRQTVLRIKDDPLALGGLVTTHKIDLFNAAHDLFDGFDESARLTGEISSIYKRDGRLYGSAKDPHTSGLSLRAILGDGYFGRMGGAVLCMGAGGAGKAIALHLLRQPDAADRPTRLILTDRSAERLNAVRALAAQVETDMVLDLVQTQPGAFADDLLAALPDHSLVINATGMGKDLPGSPLSAAAVFPRKGIVWELNYRGELLFYQQAAAQAAARELTLEDGWLYFLHGWTQVIAEVLDIALTAAQFARLAALAADLRPSAQR